MQRPRRQTPAHKYDLDRDKALAQADLDRLEKELKQLAAGAETSVKIESFPTPISKVVDEKEAHFQLRHGRLAYVPFTEFAAKFHSILEQKAHKLRDTDEITETYGPLFDFTIRYTLARVDIPWEDAVKSGQGGSYIQLKEFYFYPVSNEIGEPVADAMNKASFFRGKLEECNPKHYTITFWIYPDSFDEFNRVRKELYELGYSVAARPLPDGRRIGGAERQQVERPVIALCCATSIGPAFEREKTDANAPGFLSLPFDIRAPPWSAVVDCWFEPKRAVAHLATALIGQPRDFSRPKLRGGGGTGIAGKTC